MTTAIISVSTFLITFLLLLVVKVQYVSAFLSPASIAESKKIRWLHRNSGIPLSANEDNREGSDRNGDDDSSLFTALYERQRSLSQRQREIQLRWRKGRCVQRAVALPDWVRRVSVQWPLAACGSARGDVYMIQCETGEVLGRGTSLQDQRKYADEEEPMSPELASLTKQLFGDFDGGGTLALALNWNHVAAHAGRFGGLELWNLRAAPLSASASAGSDKIGLLKSIGKLLEGVLVTSLEWAQDDLWIGTQDGRVLVYTLDDDDEVPLQPEREWKKLGGTVMSISFHEELDVAVVAMSNGVVTLLSMDDAESPSTMKQQQKRSFYPPFDSGRMRAKAFPLCAIIVELKPSGVNVNRQFSLAVGGNDGSLFMQSLQLLENSPPQLDLDQPFGTSQPKRLTTGHMRPCKCLVSPFPGLLVSGGHDGTMRFWEITSNAAGKGMFLMAGLKVWLGSLWSDGRRLVSDGADNAVVVSDFGETPPDKGEETSS